MKTTILITLLAAVCISLLAGCAEWKCTRDGFQYDGCPVIIDPRGYSGSWGTR
jgi:hypothetical protein